ncbi:MAG: c-type cytochrome [Candidatus Binataceae bacterium]
MAKAKKNYDAVCASCHGTDGAGNGPAAATLSSKPRNFTAWRWRRFLIRPCSA